VYRLWHLRTGVIRIAIEALATCLGENPCAGVHAAALPVSCRRALCTPQLCAPSRWSVAERRGRPIREETAIAGALRIPLLPCEHACLSCAFSELHVHFRFWNRDRHYTTCALRGHAYTCDACWTCLRGKVRVFFLRGVLRDRLRRLQVRQPPPVAGSRSKAAKRGVRFLNGILKYTISKLLCTLIYYVKNRYKCLRFQLHASRSP
jgi:hypothetical protein